MLPGLTGDKLTAGKLKRAKQLGSGYEADYEETVWAIAWSG
jgi:hypothetical protein